MVEGRTGQDLPQGPERERDVRTTRTFCAARHMHMMDGLRDDLAAAAEKAGLVNYIVVDAGRTQIPEGSKTVLAIGPGKRRALRVSDKRSKKTGKKNCAPPFGLLLSAC